MIFICAHERRLLQGLNNPFSVAEWSPDGTYIAIYLSEAWAIYPAECLLDGEACTPWLLDSTANDTRVAWGPDGTTLAYMESANSASMKILTRGCWDHSGERCFDQTIRMAAKGVLWQPTWSADGNRFAFVGIRPTGLFRLDADCLDAPDSCTDKMTLVPSNLAQIYWPSLSSDGSQLLYQALPVDGVEQLYRTDIESGDVQQLTFRTGGAYLPAWSKDERYIAFGGFERRSGGDFDIYILDVQRQLTVLAIQQAVAQLTYAAWSP